MSSSHHTKTLGRACDGQHLAIWGLAGQEQLDVVLSDRPLPGGLSVKAYSHSLGECGTSWFAARNVAPNRKPFPARLNGARLLLPRTGTSMLRSPSATDRATRRA